MSILPFSGNHDLRRHPPARLAEIHLDDDESSQPSPAGTATTSQQGDDHSDWDYRNEIEQQRGGWPFFDDNSCEEIMESASSGPKPTIVVIPSSFSNEALYEEPIERLVAVGYDVIFAQLPSIVRRNRIKCEGAAKEDAATDGAAIALATMEDDAAFIRAKSDKLADEGKDVVLVAHSYSGIPMTESVRGSTKHEREVEGKTGGVVALVYISAFIPSIGESLITRMSELHPGEPDLTQTDDDGVMYLDPVINARSTFSDLPEDEGVAWSNLMENHSSISFRGKTTYEGWRYIPVTYLHTENDKIIPLRVQIDMVERVRELGVNVEVVTCGAGHCPNVSAVGEFVDAVRKGAGERRALSRPKASIYVETNTVTTTYETITTVTEEESNEEEPYRNVKTLVSEFERLA